MPSYKKNTYCFRCHCYTWRRPHLLCLGLNSSRMWGLEGTLDITQSNHTFLQMKQLSLKSLGDSAKIHLSLAKRPRSDWLCQNSTDITVICSAENRNKVFELYPGPPSTMSLSNCDHISKCRWNMRLQSLKVTGLWTMK